MKYSIISGLGVVFCLLLVGTEQLDISEQNGMWDEVLSADQGYIADKYQKAETVKFAGTKSKSFDKEREFKYNLPAHLKASDTKYSDRMSKKIQDANMEKKGKSSNKERGFKTTMFKWNLPAHLKARYTKYSDRMSKEIQDAIMVNVTAQWSSICENLTITALPHDSTAYADIRVSFDDYNWLGRRNFPGGNFAYAYFPTHGGITLDNTEAWEPQHVQAAILHEMGHSLGLSHSDYEWAVLYFFYNRVKLTLTRDDIAGLRHMYCRDQS